MKADDPLARFDIQYKLGRGAYGTVWKAHDKATNQPVAIKVIPLIDTDKDEFQAIQREIQFLAGCDHPNVVKYLGSCRHNQELWIIMEYCGGGSVNDLLSATQQPMPEQAIAYVCSEALKGLTYLHSINKVHRDIKCGNILLTETGQVKLADFGVAAQLTATMTKRQTLIGTPHWMAPEVIQESRYDGKVDVWALGISAIEMAELTPPRWNVHPFRVIFMISRDPPPKLSPGSEQWSLLFHDFLGQSLTKEPKSRPTARLLLQHRFVLQAQSGVGQSELLPLISVSMKYLSHAASTADAPAGQGGVLEMAQQATGHFSWRNNPAQGGTVLAGQRPGGKPPIPSASPAADPHTHRDTPDESSPVPRMPEPSESPAAVGLAGRAGRGRLGPAAPGGVGGPPHTPLPMGGPGVDDSTQMGAGSPAGLAFPTTVVKGAYGETVVVHGEDTIRVHAAAVRARVTEEDTEPPVSPDPLPSAFDTSARPAAKKAQASTGGGYLAAVRAAAADAQRERDRAQPSPSAAHGSPPLPHHQAATALPHQPTVKDEHARTVERLHALYESGLVVTTPFLPALHAQPAALLTPLTTGVTQDTDVVNGLDGVVYRTLATLVAHNAALSGQGEPTHRDTSPWDPVPPPPGNLLDRVYLQPQLQNGLKTLAYHWAARSALPLSAQSTQELQQAIDELSEALSTVLMSG